MKEEKTYKILLVDVSNLLFRMHYTYKHLTNDNGEKTGAIYGFLNMILMYVEKTGISNVVLCWDSPSSENWRLQVYPEYKANRRKIYDNEPIINLEVLEKLIKKADKKLTEKKRNEYLQKKMEKLIISKDVFFAKDILWKITSKLGFVNILKPNMESDDVIAMFVRKYHRNIKIISCDKDFMQLVDDKKKVRIYRPMMGHSKGVNKSYDIYNEKRVYDEFGVYPKDFGRMLAITGDDTDNVPGISGYGYKKASKLIESKTDLKKAFGDNYSIFERNEVLVGMYLIPAELEKYDLQFEKNIDIKGAQKILDKMKIKKYDAKQLAKINSDEFKQFLLSKF